MSPTVKHVVLVALAGAIGALAAVPELAHYAPFISAIAFYFGAGHVTKPGDVKP